MKLKTFLIVGCLGGLFTLSSCTAPTNVKAYSAYVNPFIGTGGHGHTFPGAVVPHGLIQRIVVTSAKRDRIPAETALHFTGSTNVKDYSAYVNPFIGTGGHGHTFPGAVVPHGIHQLL